MEGQDQSGLGRVSYRNTDKGAGVLSDLPCQARAMTARPKIKISELRDIGWSEWDPIGLKALDGDWTESGAADEYDTYLLQVVGMLINGKPPEEAIEHLVWAESRNMGAGVGPTTRTRAERTVALIATYVETLMPKG